MGINISNFDLPLDNAGTVEVNTGTLSITASIAQFAPPTLLGGTWNVKTVLEFAIPGNIVTNQGSVTLDGPNSEFLKIDSLADNQGTFEITNGRNFITMAIWPTRERSRLAPAARSP